MLEESDVVIVWEHKLRKFLLGSRNRVGLVITIIFVLILLVGTVVRVGESPFTSINMLVAAKLNGTTFAMQLSDTDAVRQKGLSGQSGLPNGQGMLFVFETPSKHCFWMKDMNFAVDILWFDAQKKLVDQALYARPASYPESFCPKSDALYVVELNAGAAAKLKLRNGDRLDFKVL